MDISGHLVVTISEHKIEELGKDVTRNGNKLDEIHTKLGHLLGNIIKL